MGRVLVRTRWAIRSVIAIILRAIVMRMAAAFRDLLFRMDVVQREHTATESGDHAEHQKP